MNEKSKIVSTVDFFAFLRDLTFPTKSPAAKPKPQKDESQRLDLTEASNLLGIGVSTLYRWLREGRVPFYRVGREYRFDREELVLICKHDLSAKRQPTVKLKPLIIDKTATKSKTDRDLRYRKMLGLD